MHVFKAINFCVIFDEDLSQISPTSKLHSVIAFESLSLYLARRFKGVKTIGTEFPLGRLKIGRIIGV